MTTIFEFFSDLFGFGDSTADAAQVMHETNPYENPGQDLIVDEIAFDIDHGLGIANPDEPQAGATDDGSGWTEAGGDDWMNDDSSSNDWMEADSYDDDTSWMDDNDGCDDSWMDDGGCDDSWMDSGCDDFGGFGDF